MPPSPRGAGQPLIVVEGPPGAATRVAGELRASGFDIVAGLRPPIGHDRAGTGRPVVCSGPVADARSAADALLAALAGVGVLAEATADHATIDRLVDDLRRIGPVDHRIVTDATAEPAIPPEARAILGLLAEGHSLGEAAALLGLSRRTADRRVSDARGALGVARTTEAIARARALGLLGAPGA